MADRILIVVADHETALSLEEPLHHFASQGEIVHVAVENGPPRAEHEQLKAIEASFPNVTFGRAPSPDRHAWHALAVTVRGCLDTLRLLDAPGEGREWQWRSVLDAAPRLARRLATSRVVRHARLRQGLMGWLRRIERALPVDPSVIEFLRRQEPAMLIVAPLLGVGSSQVDYIRAARALGIGTFYCTTDWSDLIGRGLLHEHPDCVGVWNRDQRREAIELHGVPSQRTTVIGAYGVERFVDGLPDQSRAEAVRAAGLDPSHRVILFVGGAETEAAAEIAVFAEWVRALRAHEDRRLREAAILIRPHSRNDLAWRAAAARVAPAIVIDAAQIDVPWADESLATWLRAVDALVALDTSPIPVAAACGVPVLGLFAAALGAAQGDLAAFQRRTSTEGWPAFAHAFDKHFRQLAKVLGHHGGFADRARAVAYAWVRPHGDMLSPGFITATRVLKEVTSYKRPPIAAHDGGLLLRAALRPLGTAARAFGADRRAGDGLQRKKAAQLRVLVATPSPESLEEYEPLLRQLVQHGHRVIAAFSARRDQRLDVFERVGALLPGVEVIGALPRREGIWRAITDALIGMTVSASFLDPRVGAQGARSPVRARRFALTQGLRRVDRLFGIQGVAVRWTLGGLAWLGRAVPISPPLRDLLAYERPDVVVVLPAIDSMAASESAPQQVEIVQAARAAGIPSVVSAGGLDPSINSALLHARPDVVMLWNASQCEEAMALHGLRPEQVAVTGAVLVDYALDDETMLDEASFRDLLHLGANRPYALFVGSPGIVANSAAEPAFVRAWVSALRGSKLPALSDLLVLVRPAPYRAKGWRDMDFSGLGGVVLCPREYDRSGSLDGVLLRESIKYAAVVVGANPTALALACALGRPAIAVVAPESSPRPVLGAPPLDHLCLKGGGPARFADGIPALVQQLREALEDPTAASRRTDRWVHTILCPKGIQAPVEAALRVEHAAREMSRTPRPAPISASLLRPFLIAAAGGVGLAVVLGESTTGLLKPLRAERHRLSKAVKGRSRKVIGRMGALPGRLARGLRRARYRIGMLRRGLGAR